MATDITFAPFREISDFIANAKDYSLPDFKDLNKVYNRITNNLLYYQTNYFVVFLALFVISVLWNPSACLGGLFIFIGIFIGYVYATTNYVQLQSFKKDKPFLSLAAIVAVSTFFVYFLGMFAMFVLSVLLPLAVILVHAALRLRNIKNKVANATKQIGVKRTPMGVIIEALDESVGAIVKDDK